MKLDLALIGILVLGLVGVLLLGVGYTGKVVIDNLTVKPLCEANNQCSYPEVCCVFFQQKAGVCNKPSMCEIVTQITKQEGLNRQNWNSYGESPKGQSYPQELFFGTIVIIVFLILLYTYLQSKRKDMEERSISRKISVKRKVRKRSK